MRSAPVAVCYDEGTGGPVCAHNTVIIGWNHVQYVQLGRSGLRVSPLCLGAMTYGSKSWRPWVLEEDESRPLIFRALEAGINFIDTANVYSLGVSEEIVGKVLAEYGERDALVVATKAFVPMSNRPNDGGLSRKHLLQSMDASLRRLRMDYVDLFQIHRYDGRVPIEETMEALHDLVKAGKTRYIGASSMYAWQFVCMQHIAEKNGWTRFIAMQNHYNLVYREEEREMNPYCAATGVGLIPWSPLARGFLAGNRNPGGGGETIRSKHDPMADRMYYRDEDFEIVKRVQQKAAEYGLQPTQVALAWLLRQPAVSSPIIGVRNNQQMEQALASLRVQLSDTDCYFLEDPYQPHPVLGHS